MMIEGRRKSRKTRQTQTGNYKTNTLDKFLSVLGRKKGLNIKQNEMSK